MNTHIYLSIVCLSNALSIPVTEINRRLEYCGSQEGLNMIREFSFNEVSKLYSENQNLVNHCVN